MGGGLKQAILEKSETADCLNHWIVIAMLIAPNYRSLDINVIAFITHEFFLLMVYMILIHSACENDTYLSSYKENRYKSIDHFVKLSIV